METPQHLFALSRNEQRVVIIIMIVLVGATAASRYSNHRARPPLAKPATVEPAIPLDEQSTPPPNEP